METMRSFWSRLVSWLRGGARRDQPRASDSEPESRKAGVLEPVELRVPEPAVASPSIEPVVARAPREAPTEAPQKEFAPGLRIGVDFGTTTTQVAVYLDGRDPFLLRLESSTDEMPSFYAVDPTGTPRFGDAARNLPVNYHSIKPLLEADAEIPGVGRPSEVAFLMLEEVVRRALNQLRTQRLVPEEVSELVVGTNLGCTPRFGLDARLRLRDVAQAAGFNVQLASLVEEPIAAVYQIMLSGLVSEGRVLVVDMGGGTLDIAVVRISDNAQSFEVFSSGGYQHAGDRFTELLAAHLEDSVQNVTGSLVLSREAKTLLWARAEQAKQALSIRSSITVPLGGIEGTEDQAVEVTAAWLKAASGNLRVLIEHDVATVYRLARLVLDRGGKFDPAPGTIYFDEPTSGDVRRISEVRLQDDAREHIDHVVLIGGGTKMPLVEDLFNGLFEGKVIAPEQVAIDRSEAVALGLSRPKPARMANLRYPSWGISAMFRGEGEIPEQPLYEPFAPTFRIARGQTAGYSYQIDKPAGATSVALAFRPIGGASGEQWPFVALPPSCAAIRFALDIFGQFVLSAESVADLYAAAAPKPVAPWASGGQAHLADWLPPWKMARDWWTEKPMYSFVHDM
jgi:Hsp70 protein